MEFCLANQHTTTLLVMILTTCIVYVTIFGKTDRLARKTKKIFFIALLSRAGFSLFPLVSSCLNDNFCVYAIIDCLANRSCFPSMIPDTHQYECKSISLPIG